ALDELGASGTGAHRVVVDGGVRAGAGVRSDPRRHRLFLGAGAGSGQGPAALDTVDTARGRAAGLLGSDCLVTAAGGERKGAGEGHARDLAVPNELHSPGVLPLACPPLGRDMSAFPPKAK